MKTPVMLCAMMLVTGCVTGPPASPPIDVCPPVVPVAAATQAKVADALDALEAAKSDFYTPVNFVVVDWIRMRDDARACREVLSR